MGGAGLGMTGQNDAMMQHAGFIQFFGALVNQLPSMLVVIQPLIGLWSNS